MEKNADKIKFLDFLEAEILNKQDKLIKVRLKALKKVKPKN